jgi:hypothetical protein
LLMRQQKRGKNASVSGEPEIYRLNMKDIVQKAEARKWGKAREKVNLQHLSPERNKKKSKYYDDVRSKLLLFFIASVK